jgi:hypothetical protein
VKARLPLYMLTALPFLPQPARAQSNGPAGYIISTFAGTPVPPTPVPATSGLLTRIAGNGVNGGAAPKNLAFDAPGVSPEGWRWTPPVTSTSRTRESSSEWPQTAPLRSSHQAILNARKSCRGLAVWRRYFR